MLSGYKTSNPAFSKSFWNPNTDISERMSVTGILIKTLCTLLLLCIALSFVWYLALNEYPIKWFTTGGMIVAILISFGIALKPIWAKYLVPLYAIAKGLFLGGFSYYLHIQFPNLPLQAVMITVVTFFVMLSLYQTRLIVVTKQLRTIITLAILSIMVIYITTFILSLFGIHFSFLWDTSWIAIGFNLFAAITAAFSLLLDFDIIERQKNKSPKSNEWLATWGILVSLIWLYVEVLRLLRKLSIRF